ncbi:MAG: Protein RecA [Phycisphaerae bacterium]|nr:Protein RecA [Phycisphaerae bacterium]
MADKEAPRTPEEREETRRDALGRVLQQIEKSFGKGTIMFLNGAQAANVDGISTGSLTLDIALGGTGVPIGRVVEVFGPESSGKTTLALSIVAQAQRRGGSAAFVDAEHAFDPAWAKRIGVNLEGLMVNQPSCGEEALEITELLVRSNAIDVIVVDSVAALVPRSELEGEMGDVQVGAQARLMSQALRKLTAVIAKSRTCVIFINQIRDKIGVMYGSPETTPGGRALKFYSSVRIDTRRIGLVKEGDQVIGAHVRAKVVKNKVAPPFREAEFDILFDCGISREADLLELAGNCGVLARSGAWLSYGGTRLGQGKENARQFLIDNPELFEEIRQKVLVAKMPVAKDADGEPGADRSPGGERAAGAKEPVGAASDRSTRKRGGS